MSDRFRLATGGLIDRSQRVRFHFDRQEYFGYAGDTLASALLANGVRLVGRSFKYHRPRGIYSAGPEEPNALVTVGSGAAREPNTRATMLEIYSGLNAFSQNAWPSLKFDLLAINSLVSPALAAGFYYKTFMWPRKAWMFYEHFIRRAAGLGAAAREPDTAYYEKTHGFCDVLVIGSGPAGLMAAWAAAQSGARVCLVEERARFGGTLNASSQSIDGKPAPIWVEHMIAQLADNERVSLMHRTTAFGQYDGKVVGLVQRVSEHLQNSPTGVPRQRYWVMRARQVVVAAGAIERPLTFVNNDRPGVMLAGAAQRYLNEFAVKPGERAVVFTNNDSAYYSAFDLARNHVAVIAIVDVREHVADHLKQQAWDLGIELLTNSVVQVARGKNLEHVEICSRDQLKRRGIDCDLLAVSGGWSPAVHLLSHQANKPVYKPELAAFVPTTDHDALIAGACRGEFELAACLEQGIETGKQAAERCDLRVTPIQVPPVETSATTEIEACWRLPFKVNGKQFIDLQNDVTVADIALAQREAYDSVELLKRYTTLGMGTDQGKTSNITGLANLAEQLAKPIEQVGTTTFRPPYTPVALGALAGAETGQHYQPIRRSPLHDWHARHGAVFVEAGLWMRARYYPQAGESLREAYIREASHVRKHVGLVDVSPLGKIDVSGPDAAEFLNRVYANAWLKLPLRKARYGLMLREDGIVFDDGTTTRLSEQQFFMTTTTANAARVMSHLEYLLQVVWPELRVQVTSITDQWGGMALAGPNSRKVLAAAVPEVAVDDAALPFMGLLEHKIEGAPVRILRVSFSGERAYEIFVPADYAEGVWQHLMKVGQAFEIAPYGLEAMGALRIEKGHVTGAELDGRTTLDDVGLGAMAKMNKDFIGRALMNRAGLTETQRPKLVGFISQQHGVALKAGSQLIADAQVKPGCEMLGHISSVTYSPQLNANIALGFLRGGLQRAGEVLYAACPLRDLCTPVKVVHPVFFDPDGARMRG